MKFLAVFCFLSVVVLDSVMSQGVPTRKCPPGEHSLVSCEPILERTCGLPHRRNQFGICDKPECYCDQGTVRHGSGICILPSDC